MSTATLNDSLRKRKLLSGLREKLAEFKALAEEKNRLGNTYDVRKGEVLPELVEVDGYNGNGVLFEFEGREYAAIASKPAPEKFWDEAKLTEYLKDKGLYGKATTSVLDPLKLESLMASGQLDRAELAKLQIEKEKSPSVRFINPKPESQ
jgi:hypothetical protein